MNTTVRGSSPASPPGYGVTWGGPPRVATRGLTVVAAAAVIAGMAGPAVAATPTPASSAAVSVIVQELPNSGNGPEKAVAALGGTVTGSFEVIHGFKASVPGDRLAALRATPGVQAVTEDASLTLSSTEVDDQAGLNGSLQRVTHEMTGASTMWDAGYTGAGVDVALIDSGVVPVQGLAGKVVVGPDLSFEAFQCTSAGCDKSPAYGLDTFGHGTHLAGIIAGKDSTGTVTSQTTGEFTGVAPGSRVVSVKVADTQGRTDVSQAISAIDWVIKNRKKNGLNIRVLNMSFGTDGVQAYQLDPLAYAAEQAWLKGIVVVVAAGNEGHGSAKLDNPAYDPYVIAVGGSDGRGTATTDDDIVAPWSATGDGVRNPDVVAPGQSIVSLRVPGGQIDTAYPGARTGERFFRGTGTSQSAAVVSGAAALLLQQRPNLTPDQVKALLMGTARELPATDAIAQGKGLIDLAAAKVATTPYAVQTWERSTGSGSIEKARGSHHVEKDGAQLTGEVDWTGVKWNPGAMNKALKEDTSLLSGLLTTASGLTWNGLTWNGLTWNGLTWNGLTWNGLTWNGLTWNGLTWNGLTWNGLTWNGLTWNGLTWNSSDWS
jgi:serine protease AprX